MLYVRDFYEIAELLKEAALNEDCCHASYVSNVDDIMMLLSEINSLTDATPEYLNINSSDDNCEYYSLSLDYYDDELTYSIAPAIDMETEEFYPDYGLCLVDECIPDNFEHDYKAYGQYGKNYQSPIRVYWGEEPQSENEDEDCKKCTYDCDAPCCKKNNQTEEKTKVDTDDEGKVCGFTKTWKDGNSFFTYSFHSSNEKDVIDLIKKFKIDINQF